MYEAYFGLNRPPFKITPDTSLFFGGGKRGDILAALVYAVHRGEGIVKVVGEVGSGKTMLCGMLQQALPRSVDIIYIANPSVSAEDILFVMAHELELPISRQDAKHEVIHLLQDYLVQRHLENKQVVLFIEEAQGMPLETLEQIRLLSNLETDQNKLLQIILFGQPELDENLALKSIRQLRQRITHSFQLLPLSSDEVHQYLNFRMREVGYTGTELMTGHIAKKIQHYSGGVVRRINIIADKTLLSAFAQSTHNLSTKHVIAAVHDGGFVAEQSDKQNWWPGLALAMTVALVLSLYQFRTQWVALVMGQPATQVAGIEHSIETLDLATDQSMADTDTLGNAVAMTQPEMVETTINSAVAPLFNSSLIEDHNQWLNAKIAKSREWLANADKDNVSIQVMMRNTAAAEELVRFLKNEWPLDLKSTYLYEAQSASRSIYRVFYREFDSMTQGQQEIKQLPESVRVNDPYLHSIYKMQAVLLN